MDARNKRREATRRQLEQQLRERQAREAARRRTTLIASVVGTVAVVALVIVLVVVFTGGSSSTKKTASQPSATPTSSAAPSTSSAPLATPVACTKLTGKASVTFDGVTVSGADNFKQQPKVTSKAAADPKGLECADLVEGTGAAATPSSTVTVQYTGVLYANGKKFDASYDHGATGASFSLTQVVPGFTQGIGGTGKVAPMKVGGRRIMILPAQLGYGANPDPSSGIPANAPLVFVVDLLKV